MGESNTPKRNSPKRAKSSISLLNIHPTATLRTKPLAELTAAALVRLGREQAAVEIVLCNDGESRRCNRLYLGRNYPTNVISFVGDGEAELGQLIVNIDEAQRQAATAESGLFYLLGYYILHGLLHLLGYDHERAGEAEAVRMARREEELHDLLEPLAAHKEPK